MTIKDFVLFAGKALGVFALIRNTQLRGLRILCYHGICSSGTDESKFRPKIYTKSETFVRRLNWLARKGYNILDLSQALDLLDRGRLPKRAVVITFDEGFDSFYQTAFGLLREHLFPASVYVTSYYVHKQNPIFRLAVQYMLWKTTLTRFDLSQVDNHLSGEYACNTEKDKDDVAWEIFRYAETRLDEDQRVTLARRLGQYLGVDYDQIVQRRFLHLMTPEQIREMHDAGVDIQLHTHRHQFPLKEERVRREIIDNRSALAEVVARPMVHLAYPSGLWSESAFAWLKATGVQSAATCEMGPNLPDTPRLALRRFIDSENISQMEFEAEMSGVADVLRSVRSRIKHWLGQPEETMADVRSQVT
ncbi:MAG TPA: polysaccharide deacetylase family protein [Blastocatellia bacterium]|nr:polysaccharide deacetylase family protein [Blastocatellia bacterium]